MSGRSYMRCDHCREVLGLGVHRYWHMMTAYKQRLAPETKVKIYRLDSLSSLS